MTRPLIPLLLLVVAAFAFVACDDDGDASPTATTSADGAPTATEPAAATATTEPFSGSMDDVERVAEPGVPVAFLVDVRAASHEGFDRIVFQFAAGLPGYRIGYVEGVQACGSGEPVDAGGDGPPLRASFVPAAAHDDTGLPTFIPQELAFFLPTIMGAASSCDFEGEVAWAIGTTAAADFRVTELDAPLRVVIDIAHP